MIARPVPVLMYHHVSPHSRDTVTVTPEDFSSQMRHLSEAGYTALSLGELTAFMAGGGLPAQRCVAITFDDGYLDNFVYAYPVLKEYGVKAAVFVVTGWLDRAQQEARPRGAVLDEFKAGPPTHRECKLLLRDGPCSGASIDWEMAVEMASSGLVEIGSHTAGHWECDSLTDDELDFELGSSKEAIAGRLGRCDYLCWPRGRHGSEALEAARALGYRGVFTTRHGVARKGGDPFAIRRIAVKGAPGWLASRLRVYTSPLLSGVYSALKGG